jgi:A/G-specific adenine glycosylase
VAAGCGGHVVAPRSRAGVPYEQTDRFARGRFVAALVAGEPPPRVAERVLAGLERDGLIVRAADGVRLP